MDKDLELTRERLRDATALSFKEAIEALDVDPHDLSWAFLNVGIMMSICLLGKDKGVSFVSGELLRLSREYEEFIEKLPEILKKRGEKNE